MEMALDMTLPQSMPLGVCRSFAQHMGSDGWMCHKSSSALLELCEGKDVIQLSPDGETEIHDVDPSKVYVIGGLVDHCAKKGLSRVSDTRKDAHGCGLSSGRAIGGGSQERGEVCKTADCVVLACETITRGKQWPDPEH
eukprot:scaffold990_cov393-Prasinococcus_capsulatus_cf.AAC.36